MWISHALINHLLLQQEPLKQAFSFLAHRSVRLTAVGLNIDMLIGEEGYVHALPAEVAPECHITIHGDAWSKLLQSKELGVGDISIEGDADLAMQVLMVLSQLEYEPYVDATRLFGNTIASHLDQAAKHLLANIHTMAQRFEGEVQDFLVEPNAPVVTAAQWQQYSEDIDALRDDVARLQARLHRLH